MTNVQDILEKSFAAATRLPANEAAVLFAAAVRSAAAQGATLRARLLQIDDSGVLQVAPFDDQAPETEPGYLAPELHAADAPRKSEPRVQVYAAGALGYELLTGQRASGRPPGPELSGPLGDIVRIALAADRRERFGDLTQLQDAVEGVQPRPPAEGERNILGALRVRWSRPPPEKEAVAKLIEKLHSLEAQVQQIAKAQGKLEGQQRQAAEQIDDLAEQIDRFAAGQQRLARPSSPSVVLPALLAGVLAAAAAIAGAWALGMVAPPAQLRAPPPVATPSAQAPSLPAPVPVAVPDASVAAEPLPKEATPDAGALAALADAGAGLSVVEDAGVPPPKMAAAEPPAKTPPPKRHSEVSQAAMLHAVAVSQVRRGEAALEKGRAEEALESFRAALENEPSIAVAFRGLGMAYAMQGNDAQALQAYDRYLKLAPGAPDAPDIRRSIAELKTRSKIGPGEK